MSFADTAITLYENMAVERAVDPLMRREGVGRSHAQKINDLLNAIFELARERDPDNETCPMCGGGLIKANDGTVHVDGRPRGRGGWLSSSLAVGMDLRAIRDALAAAGLERYFKVKERSRSERLVDLLRAQPGRPIGELATETYGADTPSNRCKVRALLAQLSRLGRLRNIGRGRWKAITDRAVDNEEI